MSDVDGLAPAEAALLRRVADVLIPAGDGMPSATTMDLRGGPAGVRRALGWLARRDDDLAAALGELETADAQAHAVLLLVVAAGYYADAGVRRALGYDGPRALALPPASVDADMEPLIERVRARGPRYREPPS